MMRTFSVLFHAHFCVHDFANWPRSQDVSILNYITSKWLITCILHNIIPMPHLSIHSNFLHVDVRKLSPLLGKTFQILSSRKF